MALAWHVALLEPNKGMVAERVVSAAGFTVFNPKVVVDRKWSRGRVSQSVRPYVPGYLFVRFDSDVHGWQLINRMPGSGVRSLMYAAAEVPAVVRDEALLPLFGLCLADGTLIEAAADEHLLKVGQRVKVIDGPFAGFSGPVMSVGNRIRVMVQIFGRDTPIEDKASAFALV